MTEEQNGENTIDISSILKLATNLIKKDAIMYSTRDLGTARLITDNDQPNPSEQQENDLLKEKLEVVLKKIDEVKNELTLLKEQNKNLHELILQMGKALKGGYY